MTSPSIDSSGPSWRIKRLNQSGKVYVQACIQPDRSSALFTVGLGYLGADGRVTFDGMGVTPDALVENLRIGGLRLLSLYESVPKKGPGPARDVRLEGAALKEAIKRFAFTGAENKAILAQLTEPGPTDYADMTLAQFIGTPAKRKEDATGPFCTYRVEQVADSTWDAERYVLERLATSSIGKWKMKELSGPKWQAFITSPEVTATRGPRSRKILEDAYKAVLDYAVFMGAAKPQLKFLKIKNSSKRTRKVTPLKPEEVYRLVNAASSTMHRCLFGVGAGEALRPSELVRMDWADVLWDRKLLLVRGGTKTTKSGDPIPLTSFAEGYLREWQKECGNPTSGPVWTYRGEPIKSFKTSIREAGARAGLCPPKLTRGKRAKPMPAEPAGGWKRIHGYVLRHSFATLAASSGMPLATAQSVLRHADATMLWNVYVAWGAVAENAPGIEKLPLSKAAADALRTPKDAAAVDRAVAAMFAKEEPEERAEREEAEAVAGGGDDEVDTSWLALGET